MLSYIMEEVANLLVKGKHIVWESGSFCSDKHTNIVIK